MELFTQGFQSLGILSVLLINGAIIFLVVLLFKVLLKLNKALDIWLEQNRKD